MEPVPADWTRAVAVAAHPDDLEYGAASAVAAWTSLGKEVSYVLVTRGEAGIDGLHPQTAGPLREAEQRRSAAVVGVQRVEFLDHADGLVEAGVGLRRDLARAFRQLRPEVVITLNFDLTWGDGGAVNHADHRATGIAVLDACRDAANRWLFADAGEPWQGIKSVYLAGSSHPTHFVDVTRTVEAGVASLREHKAYIEGLGRDFDPDRFIRDITGFGGMVAGCEYAVTFQRFEVG
jgi:LmbE family N-acetylglucosaminyl deacetylase